ncbi:hypothetical protein COLO4_37917 [Corchorus olitorius]|uniref:FAR1 domain-containing protein n=1 Tax=Corchorus olitorius TaxID=93759 RepID=A0A1R3FY69_9ROSI|nr:hypothetical protein COLO4_37917 [Corchorus olitorius]
MVAVAGERYAKHYKRENRKHGPKPELRIGCEAHMRILKRGDKFVVTQFQTSHNHPMVPDLIRSHRMVELKMG